MKVWTIYKREMKSFFLSPMAYIVIGFYLIITGYFFSTYLITQRYATMTPIYGYMLMVVLFISPILTMKLLADEVKLGTDQLLMTSPITVTDIVLGKFFAAITVYLVGIIFTLIYPVYLMMFGTPDIGPIFTGYLGLVLIGAAFIAVGVFASSLTENQMISGIIAFALNLLFWIVNLIADAFQGKAKQFVQSISLIQRYNNFQKGVFSLNDLIFYLSFIIFFIFLTIRVVDKKRWS